MATFYYFASMAILFGSVSGASLTAEKSMIRSEARSRVELQASGALKKGSPSLDPDVPDEVSMDLKDKEDDFSMENDDEVDMCDADYPIGKDGCTCKDGHNPIMDAAMCKEAALQAGATPPPDSFVIPAEYYHTRPKGCFKFKCTEDEHEVCYFFNPIGNTPAMCSGTPIADGSIPRVDGVPVCQRPKFLNGTSDSNGGCPDGYEVVMEEKFCQEAGICLGYCEGAEFRVGKTNESQHDEFPQGCVIHKYEGCVYYNPPLAGWGKPKRPKGTPICNVSTITDFRNLPPRGAAAATPPAAAESNSTL